VVFAHAQDGQSWDRKISALAEIARNEGYGAESVNYGVIHDPSQRMTRLVDFCKDLQGDLVLVGMGAGAHATLASASLLHARGVFLISPAIHQPGLPELKRPIDCPAVVIHGWRDELVPCEQSIRFAQDYRCALHLLDGDHELENQVRLIAYLFEYFIIALDLPALAFE
jgi:predicted alpha/beta-hydrolase family hydrolase